MAVFTWDSKYETGIEDIDDDHRKLVAVINRLFDAMSEDDATQVYGQMGVVSQYIRKHFDREEQLMDQHGYPEAELHKKAHQDCRTKFLGITEPNPKVLIVKVSVFLHDWLHEHILTEDRKLFTFLSTK